MCLGGSKVTDVPAWGRDRTVDLPIFRRKVKPVISPVNWGYSRLAVKVQHRVSTVLVAGEGLPSKQHRGSIGTVIVLETYWGGLGR